MTSRADAIEVMTIVAACHHRTAPRMDDLDVVKATADTWAEIFSLYHLELPDLIKAVKRRAATHADAPEPAEIIAVAREIRRSRDAQQGPSPEYEALCESKAIDAAELAELRRARATAAITENKPRIDALVAGLADQKAIRS